MLSDKEAWLEADFSGVFSQGVDKSKFFFSKSPDIVCIGTALDFSTVVMLPFYSGEYGEKISFSYKSKLTFPVNKCFYKILAYV